MMTILASAAFWEVSMPSSVLHGSAVKVLSSGVIVKSEGGREGFLPRREFTKLPTRDLRQGTSLGSLPPV